MGKEFLLWVDTSSSPDGEAAVRPRLTLERQVTNTLLPDCAIKPPAAQADNSPPAAWELRQGPGSVCRQMRRGRVGVER